MSKPIFTRNALPLNEKDFAKKYASKVRHGKTKKDHDSGSWASRFANRAARVEWQHDPRRTGASHPSNKG